jgi:hypothetical protein
MFILSLLQEAEEAQQEERISRQKAESVGRSPKQEGSLRRNPFLEETYRQRDRKSCSDYFRSKPLFVINLAPAPLVAAAPDIGRSESLSLQSLTSSISISQEKVTNSFCRTRAREGERQRDSKREVRQTEVMIGREFRKRGGVGCD